MIALIDLDSILYKAVYRVVSIHEMRSILKESNSKDQAKQWLREQVMNEGLNRCENEILKMLNYLQEIFPFPIESSELFITTCEKSFRKNLSKTYKSNRKRNDWVWILREHYRHNGASHSNTLEADDLISLRAKELGLGNYIVVSPDKDLKQIGGYFWSYYSQKVKDFYGNPIENEHGFFEIEYKQKEVELITPEQADYFFWKQMLMGDSSDCVAGLKGVGEKTAEKILNNGSNNFISAARQYLTKSNKKEFKTTYKLLKLK